MTAWAEVQLAALERISARSELATPGRDSGWRFRGLDRPDHRALSRALEPILELISGGMLTPGTTRRFNTLSHFSAQQTTEVRPATARPRPFWRAKAQADAS